MVKKIKDVITKNPETGNKQVKIMLTTADYNITGCLDLPIDSVVENPTTNNLLFYALNCGNMFIALTDVLITCKNSVEFKPEHVDYYNINMNIVQSCRIID